MVVAVVITDGVVVPVIMIIAMIIAVIMIAITIIVIIIIIVHLVAVISATYGHFIFKIFHFLLQAQTFHLPTQPVN